jgi:hypothetical protein
MFLALCAGCGNKTPQARVAVSNASNYVNATATQDVPFVAKLVSDEWAQRETTIANNLLAAALKETAASAQAAPATVLDASGKTAPNLTLYAQGQTVCQAKNANDLKLIEIGRQQLYQAVVNRFAGNLVGAQALLTGMNNYYATTASTTSTLQQGTAATIQAFQNLAPVLATALAPAPQAAPVHKKKTNVSVGVNAGTSGVGVGVMTTPSTSP